MSPIKLVLVRLCRPPAGLCLNILAICRRRQIRHAAMMAIQLLELPKELQLSILGHLTFAELAALSLVSKASYDAVEPVLYSEFAFTWIWSEHNPPTKANVPRLDLLLRSLLERPRLTMHANTLAIRGKPFTVRWRMRFFLEVPPKLTIEALPMDKARQFIHSTGLPNANRTYWAKELERGTPDAVITLLIALMPNLTCLILGPPVTVDNTILGHLLRHQLLQERRPGDEVLLSCLKLFRVIFLPRCDTGHRTESHNSADVLPLFYLPNLQCMSVAVDNPSEFDWPGDEPPEPAKLLALKLYRIREQRLGPILKPLTGLNRLNWQWYYHPDLDCDVSHDVVDLDAMALALSYISQTVTDLSIDATINRGRGILEEPVLSIRGSLDLLAGFGKVRHFQVPWVFLMGFEPSEERKLLQCIPRNVETLVLTSAMSISDPWNWHADGRYGSYEFPHNEDPTALTAAIVSGLEGLDRSLFPNLRMVTLAWRPEQDERSTDQMDAFKRISGALGVEVSWVEEEEYPYTWHQDDDEGYLDTYTSCRCGNSYPLRR